jgi:stage II sporulation protein D
MRSWSLLARVCAPAALLAAPSVAAHAQTSPALIPAVQVDGRGHGHGVGMAQDGALAMGNAGANVREILGQFYPGTSIGKATGSVRVPVLTANNVTLAFPEGGDIRGSTTLHVPPGGAARFYRDGNGTRVSTSDAPPPTTTTSSTAPTTTTTAPQASPTSSTLLPRPAERHGPKAPPPTVAPSRSPAPAPSPSPSPSTTSTTAPPANSAPLYTGAITVTPGGDGRIALTPRDRRYRGSMDITPVQGGLRFVNQVNVETYLRGMGEVRNPSWPAAGLQAQAIAARTYALRAMAAGGELCDTQRCQVYIGSDAEYAAMDKAVAATSGQVLLHGKSLASAVYSANAGGHSATPEEGFGMPGRGYPYLRAAPYRTEKSDEWTITIALTDVARRLNYRGAISSVEVADRGASGRAISLKLVGAGGEKIVTGLEFDASLGLRSTLFSVKNVMAQKVATLTGGSVLQAPPEEAPALAGAPTAEVESVKPSRAAPAGSQQAVASNSNVGIMSLIGAAIWGAVVVSAFRWRRAKKGAHYLLS